MDPEIKVTSAPEAPEFDVTSAAVSPEVGGTSAAEAPEVGGTSAVEAPEIEMTSAAEGPEFEVTSAAMGPVVGGTSTAEAPENKVTSAVEGPEVEETSAAECTEIEVTSAAEAPEFEATSAAAGPEVGRTSAAEAPEIEVTSAAEGPEVGGTSSAEGSEIRKYWIFDSNTSSDSIFRAPENIRYGRESDFEPKLVSIGPYYRGRQNLQPMEAKKVWCMANLLMMRPGDENKGEKEFMLYHRGESNMDRVPPVVDVDPFMKFVRRARSFYKEKFDQISDVEFVEMLLLDSCFIIRILLSIIGAITESMGSLEVDIKEVRSDLLLLANQIPLFFLNVLYYWLFPNPHESIKIRVLLLWFIQRDLPWEYSLNCLLFESDHLLDFYWKSSVPKSPNPLMTQKIFEENIKKLLEQTTNWANNWESSLPKLIANATELSDIARIKFQRDLYSGNPYMDSRGVQVEFSKGIVRMRCLKLDSTMATVLVNLIVFENSKPPFFQTIRTYIKILDDLIDSEKDVEFLQKFGVIFNTLSNHTKAATFFNDIGNLCLIDKEFNPSTFYYNKFFENVDKYYKSSWNRRWASLQNNYFNSPWAGISVFAGVMLLILTVLATFYTIYAYYNPRTN